MGKKSNSSNMTCPEVQNLLNTGENKLDIDSIGKHLDQCPECMQYSKTIESLEAVYSLNNDSLNIVPDKSVRKSLIREMKMRSVEQHSNWDKLWNLFEYRIPVYQAITGVAIIFIIFFVAEKISWETSDMRSVSNIADVIEKSNFPELYVIDSLKIRNLHNIGRNALEDSAITKYMVTSL